MAATLTLWRRIARASHTPASHDTLTTPPMQNHKQPGLVRTLGSGIIQRLVLAAFIIGLSLPAAVFAQAGTGSISGRVLNAGNGRYLNNARVTIEGTNQETFTDAYGGYRFENVPAGEARVTAGYTGLDTETATVTVVAGQTQAANFDLTSKERYGDEKVIKLDTFVVESQREYEGDALSTNEQRYAKNIKVVMSSDSFGSVNEGNPGEFLKYLPGITVDYVAADVRTVSVRGFAAQFTNVYWDGMRMTSSASGSSNRIFEFEQVSINNTSRSEVTKVPTPDMPSDSLGGTINFVSKNAFERRGAQFNYRLYLNANSENLNVTKTPGPASGQSTWKVLPNFDFDYTLPLSDTFGLVITGLSSNQYVEQHRWQPTWNFAQAGATPANPYLQQFQVQDGPKTTKRDSLGVKADWKISDTQVISVGFQNNYYHSFFGNRNLNFNVGTTATSTPAGGNPLQWGPSYVTSAKGRASVTQGSSFRDKLGNTLATKLNYTYKSGDWTATAGASYALSRSWYRALGKNHFSNIGTTLQGVSTVSAFNINGDPSPGIVWLARDAAGNKIDDRNLANYRIGTLRDDPLNGFASLKEIKADVEKQFSLAFPFSVKIGGDIREETRDNIRQQNDYTFLGADGTANTADDSALPYLDSTYYGLDPYWGYAPISWVNSTTLAQALKDHPNYFRLGTGTAQTGVQAESFRRTNSERITERISAYFIQLEGQLLENKLHFVAGVRFEDTNDKGQGALNSPDAVWQRNADGTYVDGSSTTAGVQRVRKAEAGTAGSMQELDLILKERGYTADRSYDGYYPSVHLSYDISDSLLARFSYAKTIGRPDYANIIPATTINEDDNDPNAVGTVTIRNTALKPWTADNFDLSLEYYPKHGGLFSVGVFQKDLTNFWTSQGGALTQGLVDELGLDSRFVGWGVSTTVNGGDAQIQGEEINIVAPLTFLPGWGRYFTIKANGTKLHLSGANSPDFRGFIDQTGNFNIGFNKKPYSMNLTFNFRGRQKNAPQTGGQYGATNGFYEYYAPRTFIDMSGEYKVSKNMSVFAGVRNLTNKPQVLQRYNPNSPQYSMPYRQEEFGISVSVGVKGTF